MGTTLEALLELQDIELQIVDIRRQLARKERLVRRQKAQLNAAQERLTAESEQLRRTQMEVDEIDLNLKSRTAHVNRLREHLNSVRTNREYAAVLAQLNIEKADASKLEARALSMMENVEAQRQMVSERESEQQAEAARLMDLTAQSEQSWQTFSDKLAALQHQRQLAAEQIEPSTIVLFDRLSERYEGDVMAGIERTHPRRDEFICGGCHMTLSAE